MTVPQARQFCGREFAPDELSLIVEVVDSCSGLSRFELAQTVCELLDFKRAHGRLKARECRDLLEALEREGWLKLPAKRAGRPAGLRTSVPVTDRGAPGRPIVGQLSDIGPVSVELVEDDAGHHLFRELVGRYHYLGFRVPFGAYLRYLVWTDGPSRQVLGAVQFSSPAWRLAVRDRWIGWDDETRGRGLQHVVCNSRFLVVPWVSIRNLASRILSQAVRSVARDWPRRFGVIPHLAETLVDPERYRGTCYRAANWIELGPTAGRGRMDRQHRRHDMATKTVFVYPLTRHATRKLRAL